MSDLNIQTAEVFLPLLEPCRYKGAYGGRSSGKSHFYGDLTIDDGVRFPGDYGEGMRLVCIREVQKDLKHSAKQLIEDKLRVHGLFDKQGWKIYNDRIQTPGDGIIIFQGMQDHNKESVKSLEKFHRSWNEEGQTLSDASLKMLRPTMRWEDTVRGGIAELWFSWNPRRKLDPVDVMFRQKPPTGAISVMANWKHNPWFTANMEQERLDCLRDDPEEYDHIWEGGYLTVTKGAYYAKHLIKAKNEGRITNLYEDPYQPFRVFCDIGGTGARSDAFSMWISQWVAREIRNLNYYEAQGQDFAAHVQWLRKHGYTPETTIIYLPHDGATNDRVFAVSYESAFRKAGYKVKVIPNQGRGAAGARIDEARRLFPSMLFDDEKTASGREALGSYHEKIDEHRNIGLGPEHDWSSHGADAFGLQAVAYKQPRPHNAQKPRVNSSTQGRRL